MVTPTAGVTGTQASTISTITSLSARANKVLEEHGLSDVLFASLDGGSGKIKINRKLSQGTPIPLNQTHEKSIPGAISKVSELGVGLIIHEDIRTFLEAKTETQIESPGDTRVLNLVKTDPEISPQQIIANDILSKEGLIEYDIKLNIKRSKSPPHNEYVTFTSNEIPNALKDNVDSALIQIRDKLKVGIAYQKEFIGNSHFRLKESSM